MKNSKKMVGLFVSALVLTPLSGCGSGSANEIEVCYDNDYNNYCDDDDSFYDPNSYIVVDGVKQRIFVKESSIDSSDDGYGGSGSGSFGG